AFQRTEALRTAIELDLFTQIAAGRTTAEQLAAACQASPRGVRILADFLTIAGLLHKGDGGYRLTPDAAAFLDRRSPAYLGAATERPLRVLDVAAGHGIFGITVAGRYPRARVTALDWPNVRAVASENARLRGVAARHTLLPGSAFEADWGGPYDVVLLTNF